MRSQPSESQANLRQRLITAGLAILEEENTRALTLRRVAKLANVSHMAPYRHFDDKIALLSAIAASGFRALLATMENGLDAFPDDPGEQLLEIGRRYVLFATNHPAQVSLMFSNLLSEGNDVELSEAASQTYDLHFQVVLKAQRAGILKAGESETVAQSTWAMIHGVAMLLKEGLIHQESDVETVTIVDNIFGQLLQGVAA